MHLVSGIFTAMNVLNGQAPVKPLYCRLLLLFFLLLFSAINSTTGGTFVIA